MKVDKFTKIILSVIALNLTIISVQSFIPEASAVAPDVQKVAICDIDTNRCARIGGVSTDGGSETDALIVVDIKE